MFVKHLTQHPACSQHSNTLIISRTYMLSTYLCQVLFLFLEILWHIKQTEALPVEFNIQKYNYDY